MTLEFAHIPVLLDDVLDLMAVKPGDTVVDGTAGGGGHLAALVQAVGPSGRVIAFDRDPRAHALDAAGGVAAAHPDVVTLVQRPFGDVADVLAELGVPHVDALMADLGVSSHQLDESSRGFSFMRDGPLDMRMDTTKGMTAWELIDSLDEEELADLIYRDGEERASRRIARAVKHDWPLEDSTLALADLIGRIIGRRGKIHPATRTFQALRIAVNRELDQLDALLAALPDVIAPGGRAAIIAFHSLEDRRVKHVFRDLSAKDEQTRTRTWERLTKKPRVAAPGENHENPRARSAKLRGIRRVPEAEVAATKKPNKYAQKAAARAAMRAEEDGEG